MGSEFEMSLRQSCGDVLSQMLSIVRASRWRKLNRLESNSIASNFIFVYFHNKCHLYFIFNLPSDTQHWDMEKPLIFWMFGNSLYPLIIMGFLHTAACHFCCFACNTVRWIGSVWNCVWHLRIHNVEEFAWSKFVTCLSIQLSFTVEQTSILLFYMF